MDDVVVAIGLIIALGVFGQLLAQRLRAPAIVVLLGLGLLAGPVTGVLDPVATFGDVLYPTVSIAVGLLLFEGGLQLRWSELGRGVRLPVVLLVTLGVGITAAAGSFAAWQILDLPAGQAVLLGAVLSVSGPTVIGPLLAAARPREPTRTVALWEGILIDPIGATLALICFSGTVALASPLVGPEQMLGTAAVGSLVGLVAAGVLVLLLRLGLGEDMDAAVTLAVVVAAFAVGESLSSEGGLFATTALGLAMANQRWVEVSDIHGVAKVVTVLVLGALFITMAATVDGGSMLDVLPQAALLCLVLIVVRVVVVHVCTVRARGLDMRDRAYLSSLVPRGVVAAATASVFATRLREGGDPFPELVPVVFAVVLVLAVVSSASIPLSARLGVRRPAPRGLLVVGAEDWCAGLAGAAASAGAPVLLLASGRGDLVAAPPDGVEVLDAGLDVLAGPESPADDYALAVLAAPALHEQMFVWSALRRTMHSQRVRLVPPEGWTSRVSEGDEAFPGVTRDGLRAARFVVTPGDGGSVDGGTVDAGAVPLLRVLRSGNVDTAVTRSGHDVAGLVVMVPGVAEPEVPAPLVAEESEAAVRRSSPGGQSS